MKKHLLTLVVSLSCASAWATPILDPATGHYYDVISAATITWADARVAALGSYYLGLEGHLATITGSAEDGYVGAAVAAAGSGEFWLGGYQNPVTETTKTAGWTWVNGEGTFPGVNGATGFDNAYSNWNSGEPNDAYGIATEQYLGINLGRVGGFNDEGNLGLIGGYVIEYDPHTINDVPDAGATASLLGGALFLLATLSRRLRK
jgi:hypothetical protein